ncbi:hypothetical protein [Streptomyces sp. NPDC048442]|uniref:hypothetical protein n=1 Tax=Streptomyces sp. NPDC048442 TaxID=3154823 RepID=UPI0034324F1B
MSPAPLAAASDPGPDSGFYVPLPTQEDTAAAARALRQALSAASLSIHAELDVDGQGPYVHLERASAASATALAELVNKGMRPAHKTCKALEKVLRACGLTGFSRPPAVLNGLIVLGEVPAATADKLACLLGAPPAPDDFVGEEVTEGLEAEALLSRLNDAFRKATGGGFMDMKFLPYCPRCGGDPGVELGDLTVPTARRLVKALTREGRR